MKNIAPVFILLALPSFCQQTGPATTKGSCSPAASGNNNTFNITCGIGKAQGQKMIDILNKILADQLDPAEVMKKLDEILHAVNPNVPPRTYSCDGHWKTAGAGANAAFEIVVGGDSTAFEAMLNLANSKNYSALLRACLDQIKEAPEWLSPRLLCSLAYLSLGDSANAKNMLKEFDSRTGPAYDTDGCKQLSDFLHAQIH